MAFFCIVSGNEIYEKENIYDRYRFLNFDFCGTIVTLAFNLENCIASEVISDIIL